MFCIARSNEKKKKRMHTFQDTDNREIQANIFLPARSHWSIAVYSTSLLFCHAITHKLFNWSWSLTAHHAPPRACAHRQSKLCIGMFLLRWLQLSHVAQVQQSCATQSDLTTAVLLRKVTLSPNRRYFSLCAEKQSKLCRKMNLWINMIKNAKYFYSVCWKEIKLIHIYKATFPFPFQRKNQSDFN